MTRSTALALALLALVFGVSACTRSSESRSPLPPAASGAIVSPTHHRHHERAVATKGSATTMVFVDDTHGFLGGTRHIWATSDGGGTWRTVWHRHGSVTAIEAVDPLHVWAVIDDRWGRQQELERSVDGGRTWTASEPRLGMSELSMVDGMHGWAVSAMDAFVPMRPRLGTAGWLLRTSNGGRTWSRTPIAAQSVCAASPTVAWAAMRTTVMRTTDDGHSWSFRTVFPYRSYPGAEIHCAGARVAWALAEGDGAMSQEQYLAARTLDGGASWTPMLHEAYFPLPPGVRHVRDEIDAYSGPFAVVSRRAAFFAGACPACVTVSVTATMNGGRTFRHTRIGGERTGLLSPRAISFVAPEDGWLLLGSTERAAVWTTSDAGQTWHRLGRY